MNLIQAARRVLAWLFPPPQRYMTIAEMQETVNRNQRAALEALETRKNTAWPGLDADECMHQVACLLHTDVSELEHAGVLPTDDLGEAERKLIYDRAISGSMPPSEVREHLAAGRLVADDKGGLWPAEPDQPGEWQETVQETLEDVFDDHLRHVGDESQWSDREQLALRRRADELGAGADVVWGRAPSKIRPHAAYAQTDPAHLDAVITGTGWLDGAGNRCDPKDIVRDNRFYDEPVTEPGVHDESPRLVYSTRITSKLTDAQVIEMNEGLGQCLRAGMGLDDAARTVDKARMFAHRDHAPFRSLLHSFICDYRDTQAQQRLAADQLAHYEQRVLYTGRQAGKTITLPKPTTLRDITEAGHNLTGAQQPPLGTQRQFGEVSRTPHTQMGRMTSGYRVGAPGDNQFPSPMIHVRTMEDVDRARTRLQLEGYCAFEVDVAASDDVRLALTHLSDTV